MPVVHISDGYGAFEIFKEKKIVAQPCKIFERDLIYAFYGRPAYRSKYTGNANLTHFLPCVFIFDPGKIINKIVDVYPFDTGAFEAGRYQNYFHPQMLMEHFKLSPEIKSAQQIVSFFYGSNSEYFSGRSRKNFNCPSGAYEIEAYIEMARSSGDPFADDKFSYDDRASAIEIQFEGELSLADALECCILPQQMMDISEVIAALENLKHGDCELLTYPAIQKMSSEGLAGTIYSKVNDFYEKKGIIS